MSKIIHVNDLNFETEVLNSSLPVLVDMSAAWCGPCQKQLPILELFAEEFSNTVKVVSVDIDEASETASRLNVKSIPTLILFIRRERLATKVGMTSLVDLKKFVSNLTNIDI